MYAVVFAEFTAIVRGLVLNRVAPNTSATGFSGTTPASVSSAVCAGSSKSTRSTGSQRTV
jgi:hypothetical protein